MKTELMKYIEFLCIDANDEDIAIIETIVNTEVRKRLGLSEEKSRGVFKRKMKETKFLEKLLLDIAHEIARIKEEAEEFLKRK